MFLISRVGVFEKEVCREEIRINGETFWKIGCN